MVAFSSDALVNFSGVNPFCHLCGTALKDEENLQKCTKMDGHEMFLYYKVGWALRHYICDKYPTLTENVMTYQGKPKTLHFRYKKVSALNLLNTRWQTTLLQMWISSQKKGGYLKILCNRHAFIMWY